MIHGDGKVGFKRCIAVFFPLPCSAARPFYDEQVRRALYPVAGITGVYFCEHFRGADHDERPWLKVFSRRGEPSGVEDALHDFARKRPVFLETADAAPPCRKIVEVQRPVGFMRAGHGRNPLI